VIERRLRAFDPFPGATFEAHGEAVKLWRAEVLPGSGRPGEVLSASPEQCVIACGQGALALREVQRPGGRRIDAATWLQSHPLQPGQLLAGAASA
jgi:methionyl-tRNA formyltransferase